MIVAVTTTYNEADIIETTIRHLQAEGIEQIYAADASTDNTRNIMRDLGVTVIQDNDPYHDQPKWIEVLAELARQDGAEWVIPFDADEFWYATALRPIPDVLAEVPPNVTKLYARMWEHNDWDHREPNPKPLPKVAFRATEQLRVAPGNHDADVPGDDLWGVLDLREIQFRGFEHMCTKSRDRVARIDPSFPAGHGAHQRVLDAMNVDEKRAAHAALVQRVTVYDPIPSRLGHHPDFQQV